MLVGKVATTIALIGALACVAQAQAHADPPVLHGTYRLDFDGASRTINGVASPAANTSATYTFNSSCAEEGCTASAVLLNATDKEAVSAHNPDLTLEFVDGAWKLSLPYDSQCEEVGERNQLLTWSLTPQGSDVLTGYRIVATPGQACKGDDVGPLSQPMTATRVGTTAPGVLPMPCPAPCGAGTIPPVRGFPPGG
ncbi:MAG: serine/threonine protein kinase, bacterial [Mycobacterium sp.]|nr:serine/threonine protein kinase, bacterial [Mycobacterium sp.]